MCVLLLAVCAGIGYGQQSESSIARKDPSPAAKRGMDTVVTVHIRDMDLGQAVRVLAESAGINIMVGKDVQGKVECDLADVTARDALTAILQGNGYELTPVGNVLIVVREGTVKKPVETAPPERIVRKTFTIPYTGLEPVTIAEGALEGSNAAGLTAQAPNVGKSTDALLHDMLSPVGKMIYYNADHVVVVEDYESNVKAIEEFINGLWAMPTQVFIDSKLVEVTLDAGDTLGLEWTAVVAPSMLQFNSTSNLVGPPTLSAGPNTTSPSVLPQPNLNLPATPFTFGISDQRMDVILNALAAHQRQDLQSNPRMLVMNHHKATFVAGKEIPYLTSVTVTGGLPINTYAFKEAAVRLDVTPHVSPDGTVFLDVHPTVRAQIGSISAGVSNAPPEPILSVREAATNVAMKDGMTLIIGGMVQRGLINQHQEVPFIAKIPLLGWLFQSAANSDSKTDLLFLITPRVLTKEMAEKMVAGNKSFLTHLPPHPDETPTSYSK